MTHKRALKYSLITSLALIAIVLSILTARFFYGSSQKYASLNIAKAIVDNFQSGSSITLPEIRSSMPVAPEVDQLVGQRLECSYYLGNHGLFGGAWFIIYADPMTEVVLECYILYD